MNRYLVKPIDRYAMVIHMVIVMLMVGHARASEAMPKQKQRLAYTPEDCIECHRTGSEESELQISVEAYEASVHGGEESPAWIVTPRWSTMNTRAPRDRGPWIAAPATSRKTGTA